MVETAAKTLGSTRRREETLSTAQPAEANTLSTVESVAQGGFTAPEVLALACWHCWRWSDSAQSC
jgi:hypothetical protein